MDRGRNPFSAPYRLIRGAIDRIPNPALRSVAAFTLMFAASLGIGRAFEVVLSDEQVKAADKTQKEWIASLKSFTPLSLVEGYADDVSKVMAGELVYVPPPPSPTPAELFEDAAAHGACLRAMVRRHASSSQCIEALSSGLSHADCLVYPEKPGCAELNACAKEQDTMFDEPAECVGVETMSVNSLGGLTTLGAPAPAAPIETLPLLGELAKNGVPVYFAPLAALFRSATRLINENDVSPFVAIGQIILGGLAFCAIMSADSKGERIGFEGFLGNLMIAPICIVALASVSALAAQWLMIGAVSAFSWATSLAAACCGTTSFGAACWYCIKKLGETGVEHALTKS